jgi:hypothetical protein
MATRGLTLAAAFLLAGTLSLHAQGQGGAAGSGQGAAEAGTGQPAPGTTGAGQEGAGTGADTAGAGVQGAARPTEAAGGDESVFTGCVQRASDLGARGEHAGTAYVLTNASVGTAGGDDRTLGTATGTGGAGTSPTAPASGTTADTTASGAGAAGRATAPDAAAGGAMAREGMILPLSSDRQDDLGRYLGQRVEVRGRLTGTGEMARASGRQADVGEDDADQTGATTVSPRPSAGVETGATGTAGTTGDTRDRRATREAVSPSASADTDLSATTGRTGAERGEGGVMAAFEVESLRVIGGVCETDEP